MPELTFLIILRLATDLLLISPSKKSVHAIINFLSYPSLITSNIAPPIVIQKESLALSLYKFNVIFPLLVLIIADILPLVNKVLQIGVKWNLILKTFFFCFGGPGRRPAVHDKSITNLCV